MSLLLTIFVIKTVNILYYDICDRCCNCCETVFSTNCISDFVLVYEEHVTKRRQSVEEAKHSMWRAKFLTQLQKTGLQLEKVRDANTYI